MQAALLDKLRTLVGSGHVLTGVELSPFVVEGRTPDVAVFPATVEEVTGVVTLAAEAEVPIVPWGGGTAAAAGTPSSRGGLVLGLRRLGRLVEHEPGDLTATVQAGMTLTALQASLRGRGQWLSLDPPDAERATLGGIVATNASGSRRHLYGTVRDLLIGITVVTADGAVVHGGGKVVKNVAGYDLPKLFIGSYGTLGVIVEVTVKLRPLPEHERFVGVRFERLKDAATAVRAVSASDLLPMVVDLVDAGAARALGISVEGAALVVGFDGLAEQVEWQTAELARITAPLGGRDTVSLTPEALVTLPTAARAAFGTPAALMAFSVLPTMVGETMEQGTSLARQRGLQTAWSAHAGVGIVRAALASDREAPELAPIARVLTEWREMAHAGGGHATVDWAPLPVKAEMPVWDDAGAAGRIMQRIKMQLDPRNVLNPGRFIAGI